MTWLPIERRLRDAVLEAMVPAPDNGLPAMADLDLDAFWARFEETAPLHLQFAMRAAAVTLGSVLPRVLGHFGALDSLSPTHRDQVLERAAALPLFADLVDIVKIVACLAYFDDGGVQAPGPRKPVVNHTTHRDGRTIREHLDLHTDVVIVGSGPAGAAAAREAARAGADVLVVEAGPWVDRRPTRSPHLAP